MNSVMKAPERLIFDRKSVWMSIRIAPAIKERIRELAAQERRSMATMVDLLLEEAIQARGER